MRTKGWIVPAGLAVMLLAAGPALGAPPKGDEELPRDAEGRVILPWETFKEVTGWDEAKPEAEEPGIFTLKWEEVEDLLGIKIEKVTEATRVRIPWQEFKALLEWSLAQKREPEVLPPTDWTVTAATYEGELTKDGAIFDATFQVHILKEKDWKTIPLLPQTVAVHEALLPEETYLRQSDGHYELMTTATGAKDVKVTFSSAVTEAAGANTTSFNRVPSGTCILKLRVADAEVDVKVANAQSVVTRQEAGVTHVVAALPAGAPVRISWERAIPEAEKVPPKLYAETKTLVAVGDGILVCRERIDYNILHTGVRVLKLKLPQGVSILEVTGDRVRDWRVADDELTVSLSYEALGKYTLNVTYEKPTGEVRAAGVSLPVLRAADVVREKGHIGVVALANVELSSPELKGATAIDVRELPPELLAMTRQPILLAYRYVVEQFDIPLAIKKHEDVDVLVTIVDSAVSTTMQTLDGRRLTKVVYNVRNNRKQFLRLAMPEGAEIWSASVSGRSIRPARDEQGRVLIPLVRSQGASRGLAAFPVEVVYVEKGEQPPEAGELEITLPQASEPITHLMVNLYLPKEGKYTKPWSSEPAIEGPLTVVKQFRSLFGAAGAEPEKAAAALQQQAAARAEAATAAAGATPIRVHLPIDGRLFRLEKILVLDEALFIRVRYSGWKKQ
ncbi:MAG TPA: hypothetical protein VM219_02420 [Phycisphaerae bacterium]|nr:hypothetical protein [Phycisphaerae bacterium]